MFSLGRQLLHSVAAATLKHASLEFKELPELPILGRSWVTAILVPTFRGLVLLPVLLCLPLACGRIHARSPLQKNEQTLKCISSLRLEAPAIGRSC